jgi:hypothetical protein
MFRIVICKCHKLLDLSVVLLCIRGTNDGSRADSFNSPRQERANKTWQDTHTHTHYLLTIP